VREGCIALCKLDVPHRRTGAIRIACSIASTLDPGEATRRQLNLAWHRRLSRARWRVCASASC
jgi:hypothetical protein